MESKGLTICLTSFAILISLIDTWHSIVSHYNIDAFLEKMQSNEQESTNLYLPNPVTQKPNNIMVDGRKKTLSTESFEQKKLTEIKNDMADTQIVKKRTSKRVSRSSKDNPLETWHKILTWQTRDHLIEMSNQMNTSLKHFGATSLEGMLNE